MSSNKDMASEIKVSNALDVTAVSGSGATNGAIIDTKGYKNTTFVIRTGTVTDGTYTPSFTEGDASNLAGGGAVAAADLIGTVADATATTSNSVKKIGYKGNKRYVRLTITASGVTTGGGIGAIVIQGGAQTGPVT